MTKVRIALITVWFQPNNGVAVNRMNTFANYLGKDFNLEVFTLGKENKTISTDFGKVHYLKTNRFWDKIKHKNSDSKLLHHFKTILNILVLKLNISKLKSWQSRSISSVNKRHELTPFELIISSFAPVEAHNVAFEVKKQHSEIKWIADMRDEMSKNPFLSATNQKRMRVKEKEFDGYIDAITSVSKPILDDFRTLFQKVYFYEEVRNGFDHQVRPNKKFNDVFTFVHAGTFYGVIKPDVFFKALIDLLKDGEIGIDFKIKLVGAFNNFTIPREIEPYLEFIPKVDYLRAIEYIRDADCNLLMCPPLDAMGRYTGKLFDYLSVEKPILAMIDKRDVGADLINEHKGGFVADFYDEDEIKKGILEIYDNWKKKIELPFDWDKTKTLHRKFQVDKMKTLIDKILQK